MSDKNVPPVVQNTMLCDNNDLNVQDSADSNNVVKKRKIDEELNVEENNDMEIDNENENVNSDKEKDISKKESSNKRRRLDVKNDENEAIDEPKLKDIEMEDVSNLKKSDMLITKETKEIKHVTMTSNEVLSKHSLTSSEAHDKAHTFIGSSQSQKKLQLSIGSINPVSSNKVLSSQLKNNHTMREIHRAQDKIPRLNILKDVQLDSKPIDINKKYITKTTQSISKCLESADTYIDEVKDEKTIVELKEQIQLVDQKLVIPQEEKSSFEPMITTKKSKRRLRPLNILEIILLFILSLELVLSMRLINMYVSRLSNIKTRYTSTPFIIDPPSKSNAPLSNITLREYLTHQDGFHLAMAPAFFGFYAYFGSLIVLDENLHLLPSSLHNRKLLKSVSGASAGAMAASLIAIGLSPREAAEYVSDFKLSSFADPPGLFGFLKGNKFEDILRVYINNHHNIPFKMKNVDKSSIQIEDTIIPLAITVFDLATMQGKIMTKGDLAQLTRASATFPGLFQPVFTYDNEFNYTSILIDGGIRDPYGLNGLLSNFKLNHSPKRVVNLSVGPLSLLKKNAPPGPTYLHSKTDANINSVLSLSLLNTPKCGPFAMENGPKAVEAARKAMNAALDQYIHMGKDDNHFEMNIDVSYFAQ